jgi:hypothetical protein
MTAENGERNAMAEKILRAFFPLPDTGKMEMM